MQNKKNKNQTQKQQHEAKQNEKTKSESKKWKQMDGTRKQKPMMKSELTKCKKSREQKARKTNGKTNQCILYILCLHRRGLDPRSPLCHWVLYDSLAGAAACGNPPCVTNSF